MAKIFVSYKYSDALVKPLLSSSLFSRVTTARSYVNDLTGRLQDGNHIYKGEDDGESLADFKDETIRTRLSDKIYDSSVTIVLLSKGMNENWRKESDQWIPWEVSCSLQNKTRGGRTSRMNAMIAVVLPDENGLYDYWVQTTFNIIKMNMCNIKKPFKHLVPDDEDCYIYPVRWNRFINNPTYYIQKAQNIMNNSYMYDMRIRIND